MDLHLLIKVLQETVSAQSKMIAALKDGYAITDKLIEAQSCQIKNLETEIALLKNKKNSNNSHLPPSKDENRVKRNQSLRKKTDRKPGGQPGHEGTTLECSNEIDEVIKHSPGFCSCCGNDLSATEETLIASRQIIDVPSIVLNASNIKYLKSSAAVDNQWRVIFHNTLQTPYNMALM